MSSYEHRTGSQPVGTAQHVPSAGLADRARFDLHSDPAATRCIRPNYSLGPVIDRLNAWGKCLEPGAYGQTVMLFLRERLMRHMNRDLRSRLNSDELNLWLAIFGKTLDCGWLIERITNEMFLEGQRDDKGNFYCDSDGLPYMLPAVRTDKAIKPARDSLWRKGLIEVFQTKWRGKPQWAYMPCSIARFAAIAQVADLRKQSECIDPDQLVAEVRWMCEAMRGARHVLDPAGLSDDPAFDPLRLLRGSYARCRGWETPEPHRARTRPPKQGGGLPFSAAAEGAEPAMDLAHEIAAAARELELVREELAGLRADHDQLDFAAE